MKQIIFTLLIVLFLLLQYKFWFGPGGFTEMMHLKTELTHEQVKDDALAQRNAILAADIGTLKHGDAAIEARARTELGMIKKGEVFYQIVS